MGLFLAFFACPSPRGCWPSLIGRARGQASSGSGGRPACALGPAGHHHPHHRLPAGMHMHVLHGDLLLSLAAVLVEGIQKRGPGARELVGLLQGKLAAPIKLVSERRRPTRQCISAPLEEIGLCGP